MPSPSTCRLTAPVSGMAHRPLRAGVDRCLRCARLTLFVCLATASPLILGACHLTAGPSVTAQGVRPAAATSLFLPGVPTQTALPPLQVTVRCDRSGPLTLQLRDGSDLGAAGKASARGPAGERLQLKPKAVRLNGRALPAAPAALAEAGWSMRAEADTRYHFEIDLQPVASGLRAARGGQYLGSVKVTVED